MISILHASCLSLRRSSWFTGILNALDHMCYAILGLLLSLLTETSRSDLRSVTTKWRLHWVQPPRLSVHWASSAAPRGARPASVALGMILRSGGKRRCIEPNYYIAIYCVPRVLRAYSSLKCIWCWGSELRSEVPRLGIHAEVAVRVRQCFSISSSIAGTDMLQREVFTFPHAFLVDSWGLLRTPGNFPDSHLPGRPPIPSQKVPGVSRESL